MMLGRRVHNDPWGTLCEDGHFDVPDPYLVSMHAHTGAQVLMTEIFVAISYTA
jgi:hypothetical protein